MTKQTPLKAIKKHCKECSNYSIKEVKECPIIDCALYEFRYGKNPFLAGRKLSPEQKQKAIERLSKYNGSN